MNKLFIDHQSPPTENKTFKNQKKILLLEGETIISQTVSFWARMTQNVLNCCFTVHYRVTVCGVTSLPSSVHGDESGVERLSHISTAMAVHFLLIYKYRYIQMLFFSNSKNDFLLKMLCTIFLSNYPAKTYSRHPST